MSASILVLSHGIKNAEISALLTETIFSWPGVGSLLVDSVALRDIPVVQGTILVIVLWFLLINTAVDILYAAIDPRIKQV